MEQSEREDFLAIISRYNLTEKEFAIKEKTTYPPTGVGPLQGSLTIKYKPSGTEKDYQHFGHSWFEEFEHDLKSNFYKTEV